MKSSPISKLGFRRIKLRVVDLGRTDTTQSDIVTDGFHLYQGVITKRD